MLGYGADKGTLTFFPSSACACRLSLSFLTLSRLFMKIGLIPRVCEEMYRRIDQIAGPECQVNVEVSFMEIYNENVFDLLNPTGNKSGLKVRNHPTTGPYVEDLSKLAVKDYVQIEQLMDEGSKARTVASTNMNATSSRSHAVFTIVLTITKGAGRSMVSKIHMVDLAGSERATATGASGQRLKEGANINKSLSTLGKVIAALAKKSDGKKNTFVPYRDSVLTWLLKESLGGNSKTIMLAAISPADINFEETLSTLRYADSAKQIKNAAVVNEDPTEKLIRELQEEVERLRQMLAEKEKESANFASLLASSASDGTLVPQESSTTNEHALSSTTSFANAPASVVPSAAGPSTALLDESAVSNASSIDEIRSQLMQSTKLMATLGKTWETKLAETDALQKERSSAFETQGLLTSTIDPKLPNLVNLNEDPLLSGALVYYLRLGETRIGSKKTADSSSNAHILLGGLGVAPDHCIIEYNGQEVWLHPRPDTATFVNGIRLTSPRRLVHGCRVIIGTNHIFRFNHPDAAQRKADEDPQASQTSAPLKQIDYKFALEERAAGEVNALMASTLHFDLTSEEERRLEKQMKEYYEQKRVEMEDIDKQLEALKKSKDSVFDAIDYEQSRQELVARKMSIELELGKQKEKFANFSFQVWNEKLERQQLKEAISRLVVIVDEANAISKELDKQVYYELRLRSSPPTHAVAEDLFDSGFGLYKKMLVEVRGVELRTGRSYEWSQSAFQDLIEELRALYSSYLTAEEADIEKYVGPPRLSSKDTEVIEPPTPFSIPAQEDSLRMFAHVTLRDLLYLNYTSMQCPVLDVNGQACGQLQVELDRITGESPSSPRGGAPSADTARQADSLMGREIEIVFRINKLVGLDLPAPDLYCSYQFWDGSTFKTEIGSLSNEQEQSTQGATVNFFHEERFIIAESSEDFLAYLENEPLVVEFWSVQGADASDQQEAAKLNLESLRKAYASSDTEFGTEQQKERQEDKYRMLASVLMQESATSLGAPLEYKNVMTKQEPWNAPSVQFRLRKHVRPPRRIIFQTAQLKGHPINIEACDQVTLTVQAGQISTGPATSPDVSSPKPSRANSVSSDSMSSTSSASNSAPIVINLKIHSVTSDRIEADWDDASPLFQSQPNGGSSNRRRGRSAAPPVQSPQDASDSGNLERPSSPAHSLAHSGSGLGISIGSMEERESAVLVAELTFSVKLDRIAVPVRISKMIGIKFMGADRNKSLNRTVSEVQMIEDLKMKEVLKTQEEQLAMSGSHFQVTVLQFRTVAKQVSVMIEEQKYIQNITASTLLLDRLSNELSLVDKLGTLQKLGDLSRAIGPSAEDGTSSAAAPRSEPQTAPFIRIRYPRTKEDIVRRSEDVKKRMMELSASRASAIGQSGEVSIEVSTSDVNNRMESKVSGYLSKKAGKIWKSRWCVLSKLYFTVFKTEEDETPRDILDLTNARVNDTSSARYPHSFAIVNWQNVWFFQAQNADDFKRWMEALDPVRLVREAQASKEKSLQSKLESANKALKDSSDQAKHSAADLVEAQDTILKREEEIVVLTNEVEKLQDTIQNLEEQVNHLREEQSQTHQAQQPSSSTPKAESSPDASITATAAAESALAESLENSVALQAQLSALQSRIQELEPHQEKSARLEERVSELQQHVGRLKRTVADLEAENESSMVEVEDALRAAKTKLAKAEEKAIVLEDELSEKDDHVRTLERSVTKLEREMDQLHNHLASNADTEGDMKKQLDEWKKRHIAISEQLSEVETKLLSKDRELSKAQKEVLSKTEQVDDMERQVTKLQRELKRAPPSSSSSSDDAQSSEKSRGIASKAANDKEKTEIAELKATIKRLNDELGDKAREIRSLEFERTKALKEASVDLKATIEMHEYDLEQKERELVKKTSELAAKSQLLEETEAQLEEANDRHHELKRSVATKDKAIADKQKEIEKRDRELHQLKTSMAAEKKSAASAAEAVASTHQQLFGAQQTEEAEKEKHEAQLAKKEAMIEDLREQLEKSSRSASESRADAKEQKRLAQEMQKELSKREAQLLSKERQVDELTNRCSDLERQLEDSDKSAQDSRRQVAAKSREITDLESAVESWQDKVDTAKRLVEDKERAIEEKQSELDDLQGDYDQLEKDTAALNRELTDAGRQIQELDNACFDLQRRLENALQELHDVQEDDEKAQLVRDHKKQAQQWAQDLTERDRDVERAEKYGKQLESTLDKREKRILDLEAQFGALKSQTASVSSTASRDASDLASLKRELNSKEAQIKRLQEDLESAQRETKRALRRAERSSESSAPAASANGSSSSSTSASATSKLRRSTRDTVDADSSEDDKKKESASSKLMQKLDDANKTIARLEAEAARRTSQIERLERDRTVQKSVLADLEASVNSTRLSSLASSSSNRADDKVRELQSQLNEATESAKKEVKKLERAHKLQLADKDGQIEQLTRRLDSASSAAAFALRSRPSHTSSSPTPEPVVVIETKPDPEMEKELFELRDKVLSLQSQLRQRLSEMDEVQTSSRRQDSQVRRAEERFESEKALLHDRVKSLEQEVFTLKSRLLRTSTTSANGELDETPINWKIRCQQAEKELEELRKEVRRGQGSKLPVYPEIHTKVLKGEIEVLREAGGSKSSKIEELRGKQKEIQAEKIALQTEALSLQKEKAEAASAATAHSRQASRLQEQVEILKSQLEDTTRSEKSLRKQNDSLLDERVKLVLAVKKAQIEVLAATGERLDVNLPMDL